ncbi:MAG: VWA domain-containing protein [Myxococcota bacterium]
MILLNLLWNLRSQGLKVGVGEWLAFLDGLEKGLAEDLDGLYYLARAVLVHKEQDYDSFDVAFTATFNGVELPPKLSDALLDWLKDARQTPDGKVPLGYENWEDLRKEFEKRLREQKERHDGGSRWIGTGGSSPFGNSGNAEAGIRVGGGGGGRSAIQVASERRWGAYRTDMTLEVRDFKVALAMLRRLAREGREEIDVEGTIARTAKNAGEIELTWRKERVNRVHLLLLMDVGGSMEPYAALVSRLFTAATELKTFKTFRALHFHNCPYRYLYKSYATFERIATADVLQKLTPQHRVIWVGDASMAPWELFSTGYGDPGPAGIDWIRAFSQRAPASVWLNPDPPRFWDHPTVRAIGNAVPMYHLSVDGIKNAVRKLRIAA